MGRPKSIELIAAFCFLAFGSFIVIEANGYRIGTLARMGPGYFPLVTGIAIAIIALIVLVTSWRRPETSETNIQWHGLIMVIIGVVTFGFLVEKFGFIVATFALIVLGSFAERSFRPWTALISSLILCIFGFSVFIYGLNLPLQLVRW